MASRPKNKGGFINMKINSKKFNFSYFLSDRKPVQNLDQAAREYGGATLNLDTGEQYSNIPGDEFIRLRPGRELNTLSVFVPDTYTVNQAADKELIKKVVSTVVQRIHKKYDFIAFPEKGLGSWWSEDKQEVVFDNLQIVNVYLENVTESDIEFFIGLAKYIKKEMKQEAVSIAINDALALV